MKSKCLAICASKYHYVADGKFGMTREGTKNLFSVALTAAAMNKRVSVNFGTSHSSCYINRLYVAF